ncbi:MAG: VOC family protein [Gammaproteobacteria bacterium]|nr:VOC family protein [Gammaproteobacteria bacterium]
MKTSANLERPRGINHVAYRCRDAEQTRWFYEDVLRLPLATAPVFEEMPGSGERIPYMHLFFELGNGETIAFFDQPETADEGKFARADSFDRHLALEVADEATLLAWQQHINDAGVTCLGPIDHGFVKSIYMYDPNGLQVELTCRTSAYEEEMSDPARARASLAEWGRRMRAFKERRFGAAAIDRRSRRAQRPG